MRPVLGSRNPNDAYGGPCRLDRGRSYTGRVVADIVEQGSGVVVGTGAGVPAGLISCLSPCVWPLLPGYVSFISGEGVVEATDGGRPRPLVPILLFIAGFTLVFTLLGAFASTFVQSSRAVPGQKVGGAVVIAFGALMIGYAFRRGSIALYAERRPFLPRFARARSERCRSAWRSRRAGPPASARSSDRSWRSRRRAARARAVLLLVSYSMGLGVPFLLVGLGVTRFMGAFGWVKRHYTAIAAVSGTLMIAVGVLLFTGQFTRLVAPLADRFQLGL